MKLNIHRITDNALSLIEDLGLERLNRDSIKLKQRADQLTQNVTEMSTEYTGVLYFFLLEATGLVQDILSCTESDYTASEADFRKQLKRLHREIGQHKYSYVVKGQLENGGNIVLGQDGDVQPEEDG